MINCILPIKDLIYGGKWYHLNDIKNFPSYEVIDKKIGSHIIVQVHEDEVENYFTLRNESFWEQLFILMQDCFDSPSPDDRIWGMQVFIEADSSILTTEIPEGIRYRDILDEQGNLVGTKTFADWNDGGSQPLITANDNSKVILRTNIGNQEEITMEELIIFRNFSLSNPALNIQFLTAKQYQGLTATADYQQPE